MEIYEIIALVAVTNFAGYGLAWAAVTRWGYTNKALEDLAWELRVRWERLPEIISFPLVLVLTVPSLILFFLVFPITGIYGLSYGFNHAEAAHLKLTGQFHLGHHKEKERDFELNIVPRLHRSFESEADRWSAKRLALPMYLSHWMPESLESEPSNDEEFYDLFVLCFKESLDPASDLAKKFSTAWIRIK